MLRILVRPLLAAALAAPLAINAAAQVTTPALPESPATELLDLQSRRGGVALLIATAHDSSNSHELESALAEQPLSDWIDTHAHVRTIDVAEHPALARTLNIRRVPTILVYIDGRETDRLVGSSDAAALVRTLDDVRIRHATALRPKDAPEGSTSHEAAIQLLLDRAEDGETEAASSYIASLFAADDPRNVGEWLADSILNGSIHPYELEAEAQLLTQLPEIRDTLDSARQYVGRSTLPGLRGGEFDPDAAAGYLALTTLIDDGKGVSLWANSLLRNAERDRVLARNRAAVVYALGRIKEWQRAQLLIDEDPIAYADRILLPSEDDRAWPHPISDRVRRQTLAQAYAVLLAAGREEDADTLAAYAMSLDDSAELRRLFAFEGLYAGQYRDVFLDWVGVPGIKAEAGEFVELPRSGAPAR